MITIRLETPNDIDAVRALHLAAFPSAAEADLVDALRKNGRLNMSLVAEDAGAIVGHIAYSPLIVQHAVGWALAPLAVVPNRQRQGIGRQLCLASIERWRATRVPFLVVLGDPAYYRAFGFRPASAWKLLDPFGGGDALQAMEMHEGEIPAGGGMLKYAAEFDVFLP